MPKISPLTADAANRCHYEIWLDGEKAISGEEDPHVKEARQQWNGNRHP